MVHLFYRIPLTFVNEAGLYLAIGNSRKPEAKEFMVWVFGEVLPLNQRDIISWIINTRKM